MYDLIDVIGTKLNGMDHLIRQWMTEHHIVKSTLIKEIKSIQDTINDYHNKYVICNHYQKYGTCKYGTYCWYLHPTSNDNNNSINNSSNNNNNSNNSINNSGNYSDSYTDTANCLSLIHI